MNQRFFYTSFILLLASISIAHSQQVQLDSLQKRFKLYRENALQEKVYVHLDRPLYVTGETMWFKIYYTEGTLHRPIELSKVCYVEIIDSDNDPMIQTKVSMTKGGGDGSLFIPATINSGNYTVRAYTNWMKNSSPEFYFHTTISIINPFRAADLVSSRTPKQPDAQFLPEGGHLVAGIKSKVAFRVTNEKGNGIQFSGTILDQNSSVVTTFSPLKFGIGHFYFTPQSGQTYSAAIEDENGKRYSYKLPAVEEKGYSLELQTGQRTSLKISSVDSDLPYVYLFVHTREMISSTEVVFLKNGSATVPINTAELPEGISHITLFDGSLNPVCERLYFKKPSRKLTLEAAPDQKEYDVRRKGNIDIEAKNLTGVRSDLSVSIYRLDSMAGPGQESIESYYWLSSDLKGQIESPEYYFNASDSISEIAVDNLMLTHGWSRFNWKDVVQNKKASVSFLPEYRNHIITSEVLNSDDKLVKGITTFLAAPGKVVRLYGSQSDANGRTIYEMQDFVGPHKILIQANRLRDSLYTTRVVSPFSKEFMHRSLPPFKITAAAEEDLVARTVAMQVQDVYADERANVITNPVKDSTAFYGTADEHYLLDDYTRFQVMEEVMREYVPGVLVRKRRNGFHFIVIDKPKGGVFQDDPLILLDGLPIFDADEIMAFDPLKVKSLDVLTRQYYLGTMVFQGVVSYSTYTGDLGGFRINPRLALVDYEGLQLRREYYSPVYEDKKSRASRLPDQRNLIYWNPHVKIESNKKQTLSFYTSDVKGKYMVVIKGMSEDGSPASTVTSFNVRRFDY